MEKKRFIHCENDIKEDNLVELIKKKMNFKNIFDGKEVIRKIYVKNKLINFITK